jgi:hypothetical protein
MEGSQGVTALCVNAAFGILYGNRITFEHNKWKYFGVQPDGEPDSVHNGQLMDNFLIA